jgi:hypothetical protein
LSEMVKWKHFIHEQSGGLKFYATIKKRWYG